jgi:hypothetical protein
MNDKLSPFISWLLFVNLSIYLGQNTNYYWQASIFLLLLILFTINTFNTLIFNILLSDRGLPFMVSKLSVWFTYQDIYISGHTKQKSEVLDENSKGIFNNYNGKLFS